MRQLHVSIAKVSVRRANYRVLPHIAERPQVAARPLQAAEAGALRAVAVRAPRVGSGDPIRLRVCILDFCRVLGWGRLGF